MRVAFVFVLLVAEGEVKLRTCGDIDIGHFAQADAVLEVDGNGKGARSLTDSYGVEAEVCRRGVLHLVVEQGTVEAEAADKTYVSFDAEEPT